MPELPRISGDEAIRIFKKLGFHEARQTGSHVVMRRDDKGCVIPRHKALAVGTLRSAIRQAEITTEEFVKAS
jgi:predicted RNA binding protein YcfA (HicA-like mRNA interferase family)